MKQQRTLSVRMDLEEYTFVNQLAREEKENASKEVRKLVDLGRLLLGIEKYKNREVSLGKAADLAGLSVSEMINKLAEYRIKSNLTYEDYEAGLKQLKSVW